MKKILSLLTLLLCVCSGAWAADGTYVPQGVKTIKGYSVVYCTDFSGAENNTVLGDPATDWYVHSYVNVSSQSYTNITSTEDAGNPQKLTDNIPSSSGKVGMLTVKTEGPDFSTAKNRTLHMHVKGATSVIYHGRIGSSDRGLAIACTEYVAGATTTVDTSSHAYSFTRSGSAGMGICQITGLDATKEYIVTFYAKGSDVQFYCAEFIGPNPIIADGGQPVSASYIKDDEATALTVTATTKVSGTLSYQWYSCDEDGSNEALISGATSNSYTPSTAASGTSYYFCRVTNTVSEVAYTTDSNIATIEVAGGAVMPTVSVTSATSVDIAVNGTTTFTIETTGTPSPNIKWYYNTEANTTTGTEIAGATDLSYSPSSATSPSTNTAGTTYYYATATNAAGTAVSGLITLNVLEVCATPSYVINTYDYDKEKFPVEIISSEADATVVYQETTSNAEGNTLGWSSATIWTPGTTVYISPNSRIAIKVTKDGKWPAYDATGSRYAALKDAPTGFSPERLTYNSSNNKAATNATHGTVAAYISGNHFAGSGNDADFKLRYAPNSLSIPSELGTTQAMKIEVRDGYKLKKINFVKLLSNDDGTTGTISSVYVDNVETPLAGFEAITIPAKNGTALENKEIDLGEGASSYVWLVMSSTKTQYNASISFTYVKTKSITAAGYATLYTNCPLNFEGSGLTAYTATVDGATATFVAVTSVPAKTGVLLKGDAGNYEIAVASSSTDVSANKFEGVLENAAKDAGSVFVLMDEEKGVGFYKNTNAFTVGAHTAYIPAESVSLARTFIGFGEDEPTGIKTVDEPKVNAEDFYNLAGQRVREPMKGLYIVNGKKVIIK